MRANASIITPPHELLEQPRIAPEHQEPDNTTTAQNAAAATASQVAGVPPQPQTLPEPTTAFDALRMIHTQQRVGAASALWLAKWFRQHDTNPLPKQYMLGPVAGADGVNYVLDRAQGQPAKSITVLVPYLPAIAGAFFCVGIGGRSATLAAGAFIVPTLYATIPLQADDVRIGFDPAGAQPGANTPVFVLRWSTVQPFAAK
jgi:hypothetical protein